MLRYLQLLYELNKSTPIHVPCSHNTSLKHIQIIIMNEHNIILNRTSVLFYLTKRVHQNCNLFRLKLLFEFAASAEIYDRQIEV